MSDLTFEDAVPVKSNAGGSNAAPNPFTEVIAAIALKKYTKDDAPNPNAVDMPVAKSYVVTHKDEDALKTDRNRITRQISAAGGANSPKVTARRSFEDAHELFTSGANKGKVKTYRTRVTFWTVPPHKPRTRKLSADNSVGE